MKIYAYQHPDGRVTYAGSDVPAILMWLMYGIRPKRIYAINVKFNKEYDYDGGSPKEERRP